jgi:hypothetical protein
VRGTSRGVNARFDCCGESKGAGSSKVEEERELTGDFKEGVKRFANVLRNADGEFMKTAGTTVIIPFKPKERSAYKMRMLQKGLRQATTPQI